MKIITERFGKVSFYNTQIQGVPEIIQVKLIWTVAHIVLKILTTTVKFEQAFLMIELSRGERDKDCIYITTLLPEWDESNGTFYIDFEGRIDKNSKRNFQLMVPFFF